MYLRANSDEVPASLQMLSRDLAIAVVARQPPPCHLTAPTNVNQRSVTERVGQSSVHFPGY